MFNHGSTNIYSLLTDKPVALGFQIELEFTNVGFWGEGKTKVPGEKSQQQTQPTYDAGSGNRTWATLVGGERSHHRNTDPCSPCTLRNPQAPSSVDGPQVRHSGNRKKI